MHEKLFRGKRKDNGELVEGYYFERRDSLGNIIESLIIEDAYEQVTKGQRYVRSNVNSECFRVDPNTVGQYTGKKDKNGVKVFEGDIVKARVIENGWSRTRKYTETYVVTYHPQYCYFYLKREGNNLLFDGNWSYGVFIDEVIGNIYDNR